MRKSHVTFAFFNFFLTSRTFFSIVGILALIATPFLEISTASAQGATVPVNDLQLQRITQQGLQQAVNTMRVVQQNTTLMARVSQSLETKENILDGIAFAVLNTLISYIGDSIVQWIQGGFQGGPGFIQDPGAFFTDLADHEIGAFIASSDFGFLCNQFDINFALALELNLATGRFKQRNGCTLSRVIQNTQDVFNRTSANGWDSWISMTGRPQNNMYGAFTIAQAEAGLRIANKTILKDKQLSWGRGFLSQEKCYDTSGNETSDCSTAYYSETVTPGSVVETQINDSLDSGKRRLEVADEINEIIGALMNQLLSTALNGLAGATTGNTRNSAQAAFDDTIIGTRAGGTLTGPDIDPPPPLPDFIIATPTPPVIGTSTPIGGGPATSTTAFGLHLVGADINGTLRNVNVTNMRFTPVGTGLRIRAASSAIVQSTGSMIARAGTVYLCHPAGCATAVRTINIATQTVDGIMFSATSPIRSSSGIITADDALGLTTGAWANGVDTRGSVSQTVGSIIGAEITGAQIIGNITPINLVGGQLSGTLVYPPSAHLAPNTTYTDNGSTAPVVYRAGTTINVIHIETGQINGGTVITGGTLLSGTSLASWTVANNYFDNNCFCTYDGGTVADVIPLIGGIVSTGGLISSGFTTGEADVIRGGVINGTVINQGTLVVP